MRPRKARGEGFFFFFFVFLVIIITFVQSVKVAVFLATAKRSYRILVLKGKKNNNFCWQKKYSLFFISKSLRRCHKRRRASIRNRRKKNFFPRVFLLKEKQKLTCNVANCLYSVGLRHPSRERTFHFTVL